ncbi:MAG: hypothetical protein H0U21_01910 [Acidimicrobiia bacterium]|nr:hypothetical protein [Acidimicrobiia bacterium]
MASIDDMTDRSRRYRSRVRGALAAAAGVLVTLGVLVAADPAAGYGWARGPCCATLPVDGSV